MPPNIFDFVRTARQSYQNELVEIVEGYEYSQYETIRRVELYSNSRYLEGQTDALGRIKPFYNIVDRLVTLSDTAEDIDRKDITLTSDNPEHYVKSMMFTKGNQRWMEKEGFGKTINEMTHTRGKYGGVLVKKVETKDDLHIYTCDWRNVVTDQTDVLDLVIERQFYTPAKLLREGRERKWNMDKVTEAIEHAETNQDDDETEGYNQRKTATPFVEVWEAHGVFPKSYWATEEEENEADERGIDLSKEYEQRVFILSDLDYQEDCDGKRVFKDDCVLFTGREEESPYKYLPYERVPGRGLGVGRVEKAFESQTWTNDIILKQKNILDLPTLIVTDDQKLGRNVIQEKHFGDVMKISQGRQAYELQIGSQALQFMPGLLDQWNTQIERSSSTYAANTGGQLPSGTPYRLGALLNEEANSIFNDRRDEMGMFIGEIYTDWVIPYLKRRFHKKHILVAEFDMDELQLIDDSFVNYEVKERFLDTLFMTKSLAQSEEMLPLFEQEARERVTQTRSKRFLSIPDGYFDDAEFDIEVHVTNEKRMKAVYLETLSNILTTVTNTFDPNTGKFQVLEDPKLSRLFGQIMETAGYSPLQLQAAPEAQSAPVQAPPGASQMPGGIQLPPELANIGAEEPVTTA